MLKHDTAFPRDAEFLEYIRSFVDESRLSRAAADRLFALARRGAAMQWRPIEEAPKDGRHILLRIGNLVGSGRFGHPHAWGITDNDGFYLDGADLPSGATHWMPLPPPPKGETNE